MTHRVLIADDEDAARKLVARICRELGWEVDVASDGHEAIDLMRRRPHEVFVFDMKMPGLSGLELAGRVPEHEEAPAVLIITGYAEVDTAVQAMKQGVLDYIQKPIDVGRLRDLLVQAARYHDGRLRSLKARREREQSLRNIEEANERFRAMLELSRDAIFFLDARSGEIIDCNATAYERLGLTRQQLLGTSLMDTVDLPPFLDWESFVSRIRDTQSLVAEGRQLTKAGVGFPVELSLSFAYLTSGEYVTAVVRDITERKRAEGALEQARTKTATEAAKLRAMIEGMEQGIVFADESDAITEVNDWLLATVRMPREMVVGTKIWGFDGEDVARWLRPLIEDFQRGISSEKIVINQDFMGRPTSIRIQPVFHDGRYHGVILNVIDVTDLVDARKKAEEASQFKTESLAQMSFEMRIQLDGIAEMTGTLLGSNINEEQRVLLETINDCTVSLSSLVSDIHNLSKSD